MTKKCVFGVKIDPVSLLVYIFATKQRGLNSCLYSIDLVGRHLYFHHDNAEKSRLIERKGESSRVPCLLAFVVRSAH